jgi:hypothetical protein
MKEWSAADEEEGEGGLEASDSEDSMGSKSGIRKECCEQENQDRRLAGGISARCISKNKGFEERS